MVDKVDAKLTVWKQKALSIGGRLMSQTLSTRFKAKQHERIRAVVYITVRALWKARNK